MTLIQSVKRLNMDKQPQVPKDAPKEKRAFARIDDTLAFNYKVVSLEEFEHPDFSSPNPFAHPLKFLTELKVLDLEASTLLKAIQIQQPTIAEYMKLLEKKINHLSQAITVLVQEAKATRANEASPWAKAGSNKGYANHFSHPPEWVNLSESGMGFITHENLSPGTPLKIIMLLTPSYQEIQMYGKVAYSVPRIATQDYRASVSFSHMSDNDRQALALHMAYLQTKILKDSLKQTPAPLDLTLLQSKTPLFQAKKTPEEKK